MSKGVVQQLLPALVVPLVLVIMVAVFYSMQDTTKYSFEVTYTNESVAIAGGTGTVTYPPITSITRVGNDTDTFTAADDYNITESNENGEITFGGAIVTTPVDVTYVGHGGSGWDTFKKVRTGTWGGFKLASLLPYIIIAMVVLGLLLGAFLVKSL